MPTLLLRPSWRALQLLTLLSVSVSLCLVFVYTSSWGETTRESAAGYIEAAIKKLPGLRLETLTHVSSGIVSPDTNDDDDAFGDEKEAYKDGAHPIDHLIAQAEKDFKRVVDQEAESLADAAAKYRKRRGRHPPPHFDAWYNYASEKGSLVIEDFFHQIYHDLEPFREDAPPVLRLKAEGLRPRLSIRNGEVKIEAVNKHPKLDLWSDMLNALAKDSHVQLPDVDIPINVNDEPALAVPWEAIDTALSYSYLKILPSPHEVATDFSGLAGLGNPNFTYAPDWLGPHLPNLPGAMGPKPIRPYWSLVRPACHPDSPARKGDYMVDIWHLKGHESEAHAAINILPKKFPDHTLHGYVRNWTTATEICAYPYLQGLHGAFVAPDSLKASEKLFPMFGGGAKFSMNNDVLIPGAGEWNNSADTSGVGNIPWEQKQRKLFWRGPASGGHNIERNWQRFHRHRFVSMLNASQLAIAESLYSAVNTTTRGTSPSKTFRLPPKNPYGVSARNEGRLAEWVESWADVAFTDLNCDVMDVEDVCPYNSMYFYVAEPESENEREVVGKYKYTSILDGSGGDDGGAFIKSSMSGAVTIRASVYRNWYDARVFPWLHFVPMDNTFIDIYGIMEYFLGSDIAGEKGGHDAQAKRTAETSKEWAGKVLRREDMLVYVYRLILEYARMMDDSRERLGWVGDLVEREEGAK